MLITRNSGERQTTAQSESTISAKRFKKSNIGFLVYSNSNCLACSAKVCSRLIEMSMDFAPSATGDSAYNAVLTLCSIDWVIKIPPLYTSHLMTANPSFSIQNLFLHIYYYSTFCPISQHLLWILTLNYHKFVTFANSSPNENVFIG
jgi:hypothetical protein